MDTALGFGNGYPLDPMDAGFILELSVGAGAFDFDNVVFELDDLSVLAMAVAGVHAEEVFSPNFGFFTSGGGSEFENGNVRIRGVFR